MSATKAPRNFAHLSIGIAILLTACTSAQERVETADLPPVQPSSVKIEVHSSAKKVATSSKPSAPEPLPEKVVLGAPFAPQAPFANWDALHEEACEEMSMIMVSHALKNEPLPLQKAEDELQVLTAWQNERGYGLDTNAQETSDILMNYFKIDSEVRPVHSADDLRRVLADGHLIIIPAAGRQLGNPYFSGEGPWYHMLVITGYEGDSFIANDPGTKRGAGFQYPADRLVNAIHDWTGVKENTAQGRRVMIVITPKVSR